jgi:hypothetical protein
MTPEMKGRKFSFEGMKAYLRQSPGGREYCCEKFAHDANHAQEPVGGGFYRSRPQEVAGEKGEFVLSR